MSKVVNFPYPKRMKVKAVLETDFQYLLDKLHKMCISHGRSQGFMIGILVANVTHFVLEVIFKHWLGK